MEWIIIRLRFATTLASFKKSTWQIFSYIIGILMALATLAVVIVASVAGGSHLSMPSMAPLTGGLETLVFTLTGMWWLLTTLLISGQGGALDARKFAIYGISIGQITRGILFAGFLTVPAITTIVSLAVSSSIWRQAGTGPLLFALIGALLSSACIIMISRAVAQLAESLVISTKGKIILTTAEIVVFIALMYLPSLISIPLSDSLQGPAATAHLLSMFSASSPWLQVLGWLPWGAGAAIPYDVISGNLPFAILKIVLLLAVIAACYGIYLYCLRRQEITQPIASVSKAQGLGTFNQVPDTPSGAVIGRLATSWIRDVRYLSSLGSIVFLILTYTVISLAEKNSRRMVIAIPILVAWFFGMMDYNGLAMDGKAFTLFTTSGMPGWKERLARSTITMGLGMVFLLISSIIMLAVDPLKGNPLRVAAYLLIFGISFCIFLSGLGISMVSSTKFISPVASAQQPFKSPQGRSAAQIFSPFIFLIVDIVLCLPSAVAGILALINANFIVACLSVFLSFAVGITVFILGVRIGGKALDSRGPEILTSLENVTATASN
ncbi:membrane protein [Scardovia inopinata]|uniref:Uncharacterized protein n=1 Tax=Scardovia inopinata F0304 TaxID=641146 RepID=W5IIB7_SCAIO|nr:hypothetical protein [Scardovia inopinata]EFG26619.1 hypothetical protein HMPREF9020_00244 [Scardovia inopinata F0304]BAR06218.1 conserved hypothetical protein [Scardovia inopinata JCM 12537]SUV51737.1 membrane protein [Scardovia inopinata]